jgi:hypothetical protein
MSYIQTHAAELQVIVPIILFVLGGIGYLIKHFYFEDIKGGKH